MLDKAEYSAFESTLNSSTISDVTKALDAETEAKTEAGGFEAEAEAVAPETEAEAQGSWTILFAVQSSVTTTCL